MDPQFGGVSYPETANYTGSRTMIQQGMRPNGATRAWAVSSLVLGSLYLLSLGFFFLIGHLFAHTAAHQQFHEYHGPMPVPGAFVVFGLMCLLSVGLAFGFVVGGGGVLGRLELGRKALALTSGTAIVASLIWLAATWGVFTDPHLMAMMMANAPHNPELPGPAGAHQLMQMSVTIIIGMASIISAAEVIYCGFLCHHMLSRDARAAMKSF